MTEAVLKDGRRVTVMTVREFAMSEVWKRYEALTKRGVRGVYNAIEQGWLGVHRFGTRRIWIDPIEAEADIKRYFYRDRGLSEKMKSKLIFC